MKVAELVLFCWCLVRTGVSGATNWPVFFEHLGNVHSIHNKWDLTLSIDTRVTEFEIRLRNISITLDVLRPTFSPEDGVEDPELEDVEDEDINTRNANVKAVFTTVQDHWDSISNIYKKRVRDLLVRLNDYKSLGDKRSFEKYARSHMNRRPKSLDFSEETDEEAKSRQKRAACNGASGLFGLLFGIAYQPNIDCINDELEKFRGSVNGNIDNLVNVQNKMSNQHSKEMRETKSMVMKVEKMTGKIEHKMDIMELRSGVGQTGNVVERTMLHLQEVDAELRDCEHHLAEMERVMTSLAGGRLTQSLISAPRLKKLLRNVESSLPQNFTLLYPSHASLWPYYSVLSTSIYFSNNLDEMIVAVSVPLIDQGNELNLYRVHNLPLKVRNGYSVTADINTDYLLIGRNGEYNLAIKKEDFQDCQVYQQKEQQFFCGFGPLLQSKKSPNCAIQLFNVEGDGAMCQSRLTHGLVQPFTRLYNGSWVFAALNQQVPVLMNCPNSSIPTSLLGFGVINLPDGCTLTSDDYYYPHTFSGFTDMTMSFKLDEDLDDDTDYDETEYTHTLHQIRPDDSTYEEPLIISAVEAEVDDEEYYDLVTTASERMYTMEDDDIEGFSDDVTTKVSVEMSYNVLSNDPEIVDNSVNNVDDNDDNDKEYTNNQEDKTDNYIITKDDFINNASEDSSSDELKVIESPNDSTEVHHDVLVKLKSDITNGNNWLININNAVRELRKLM